jgi:hypothetical protein
MSTETSSWDDDAPNTSALSKHSRSSLTPLTENLRQRFFSQTQVSASVGDNISILTLLCPTEVWMDLRAGPF